ncbi:MAG: GNAT family N-acetyltransferase [Candidatus Omnitrophota bacterium]
MILLKKIKTYLDKHGMVKTLLHAFDRLGLSFYYRKIFFLSKDLDSCLSKDNLGLELTMKKINRNDLEEMEEFYDGWRNKGKALKHLTGHKHLYSLSNHKTDYAYTWVDKEESEIEYFNIRYSLPRGTVSLAYNYVVPEHRGKGMATHSAKSVMGLYREYGFKRMITVVEPKNKASLRVKEKLGFSECGKCIYIRFLFIKLYYCRKSDKPSKIFTKLGMDGKEIVNYFIK